MFVELEASVLFRLQRSRMFVEPEASVLFRLQWSLDKANDE